MPDQNSAAKEHAIMQEITGPLASLPEDPLPIAADVDFPLVLRGYDRMAVDAYVKRTSQLVAELQTTRSPEAAVRRALERVGEEVSGILKRAHETASQITIQSRSEAEDRLDAVRKEAASITVEAENRVKQLDAETDRIWEERHRIVEDTRELARQMLALAETAAERFPAAEESGSGEVVASPGQAARAPSDDPADDEEHPPQAADVGVDDRDEIEDADPTIAMPPLGPSEEPDRPAGDHPS